MLEVKGCRRLPEVSKDWRGGGSRARVMAVRYTANCRKRVYYVDFARDQGAAGTTEPCERNVVDSFNLGFGHRDHS